MNFSTANPNKNSTLTLNEKRISDTLTDVEVKLVFSEPVSPMPIRIRFYVPCVNMYSVWGPSIVYSSSLNPDWSKRTTNSRLAICAPLHCLISQNGHNRMTIALSDAATPCSIRTGVREEDGNMECDIVLFSTSISPLIEYSVTIRLDFSDRLYFEAVRDIERWWSEDCGYPCAHVPPSARDAVYSSWYSFHQALEPDALLAQCREAVKLGMKTLIIDDGWQTDDNSRGYSYCGDWQPAKSKIPDIKKFVDSVHSLGMKVVFWYAVPFIGKHSSAYKRFSDMLLGVDCDNGGDNVWYQLDPRYPEVRAYLVDIYRRAMLDWGLDGFKLDFIDSFRLMPSTKEHDDRRDTTSLEEGIDRLLSEVNTALRAINNDVMLEFRQGYIGPVIRKYGNMFRVADCPLDMMKNRTAAVQLRYLLGKSAVHSDMLMWHPDEPDEAVARQLLSTLFTVPQISVRLDKLSPSHRSVLSSFLTFWNTNKDIILDGSIEAYHPEAQYTQISAIKDGSMISVLYSLDPLTFDKSVTDITAFNCRADSSILIDCTTLVGKTSTVYDCHSTPISTSTITTPSLQLFNVPDGGKIRIR